MSEHLLLTGATGFIGARLLEKWLRDTSAHVTCLVRPGKNDSPLESLQRAMSSVGIPLEDGSVWQRITVVQGDLVETRLGMRAAEYERLTETVSHIIHCGAVVRFDLPLHETRRINTDGTRTTLELAARCERLRRYDYVSTAYVAGCRTGVIREDELLPGHAYNNSYEQSKFEAEELVTSASARLPVAVYRPSIVVCDARSGDLPPNGAFTRLLKAYAAGEVACLPGKPDVGLDLVTADFVAAAMHALGRDDNTIGRRFHLCAGTDNLTTMEEIIDSASVFLNREKLVLLSLEEFDEFRARAKNNGRLSDQQLVSELDMYLTYLNKTLHFDDSNTRASLQGTGIRAPRFSAYFAKMAESATAGF
jgi:thioester reductase-like protein